MDMGSLSMVKAALKGFVHDRLDILMCSAGIMAAPAGLSKDGFEIQFAINHLGNAMIIQQLLPVLERTAEQPGSDVRIVCLTSTGWRGHPKGGILFDKLRTTQEGVAGSWIRYGCVSLRETFFGLCASTHHEHTVRQSLRMSCTLQNFPDDTPAFSPYPSIPV